MEQANFYGYSKEEYMKKSEEKFRHLSEKAVARYYGFKGYEVDDDGVLICGDKKLKLKKGLYYTKDKDKLKKYDGLALACSHCYELVTPGNKLPTCDCGCQELDDLELLLIEIDRRYKETDSIVISTGKYYGLNKEDYLKNLEEKFRGKSNEEVARYYGFSADEVDLDGLLICDKADKIKEDLYNARTADDIKQYNGLALTCEHCYEIIEPGAQVPDCECRHLDIEDMGVVIIELARRYNEIGK